MMTKSGKSRMAVRRLAQCVDVERWLVEMEDLKVGGNTSRPLLTLAGDVDASLLLCVR